MVTFIGEHTCKLDAKGRVIFPATFKKQVTGDNRERYVVKTDIYEKCLVLYPNDEWERQVKIIRKKINPYSKEHNMFLRRFFKGVAEVNLDANNRLLLPKRLLDEIGADKDLILAGQFGKIEIWAKERYERIELSDEQYAGMAEDIFEGLVDETEE